MLSTTDVMIQVAQPGGAGAVIGWKAWSMPAQKKFDSFFDDANNTPQTTGVVGSNVLAVYAFEPMVANGNQLVSNRSINNNADRVRLGTNGYATSEDNEPGLGTQMNQSLCIPSSIRCYRHRDVELLVSNTSTDTWCTSPTADGQFKWIGTDGGCGSGCGASNCLDFDGQYPQTWTYRIYVR